MIKDAIDKLLNPREKVQQEPLLYATELPEIFEEHIKKLIELRNEFYIDMSPESETKLKEHAVNELLSLYERTKNNISVDAFLLNIMKAKLLSDKNLKRTYQLPKGGTEKLQTEIRCRGVYGNMSIKYLPNEVVEITIT